MAKLEKWQAFQKIEHVHSLFLMVVDTHVDHREHEEQPSDKERPCGREEVHVRGFDGICTPNTGGTRRLDRLVESLE
jgi:hypothetical protein